MLAEEMPKGEASHFRPQKKRDEVHTHGLTMKYPPYRLEIGQYPTLPSR